MTKNISTETPENSGNKSGKKSHGIKAKSESLPLAGEERSHLKKVAEKESEEKLSPK